MALYLKMSFPLFLVNLKLTKNNEYRHEMAMNVFLMQTRQKRNLQKIRNPFLNVLSIRVGISVTNGNGKITNLPSMIRFFNVL